MSKRDVLVAPSLLAANLLDLETELMSVESAGADFHHLDIMDGHFVPNLSYGIPVLKAVKKVSNIPLDVHVMISNPDSMADLYLEAGADVLVFHIEASLHPHRLVQRIKKYGSKAGIALNPGTSLSLLEPLLGDVDVINVMSVNPGFGGQKFIERSMSRISRIKDLLEQVSSNALIEVDGGINRENAPKVVAAGADILVAGTAVFGVENRIDAIKDLKRF